MKGGSPAKFPPSLGLGAEHRRTAGGLSSGCNLELFSSLLFSPNRTQPGCPIGIRCDKWVCGGLDVVVSVVA